MTITSTSITDIQGTITCALALADYNSTHSLSGASPDSNGIELDNNAEGSSTTLLTHPVINNLTIIIGAKNSSKGVLYENGIHIRRHGRLTLNNAVVTGYPVGIKVEGTGSELSSASAYSTIQFTDLLLQLQVQVQQESPAANLRRLVLLQLYGV